jgi:hypothetical protein
MLSESEIRQTIKKTTKDYWHVLDCYPATVMINAPRALMQQGATIKLDALYEILGEKRPKYKCDDSSKLDH